MLTASADSLGRYRIEGGRPGRHLAGFLHPALDVLGLDASMRLVEIPADSVGRLDLAIPAGARLRTAICGAGAHMTDSAGVVVGQVRDAETDAPPAHASRRHARVGGRPRGEWRRARLVGAAGDGSRDRSLTTVPAQFAPTSRSGRG